MTTNGIIEFDLDQYITVSAAMETISMEYRLPIISGGSGRGWSFWSTLQRCPYQWYLKYIVKLPIEGEKMARDVGSVVHAFLAWHYIPPKVDKVVGTPEMLRNQFLSHGCNPQAVYDGWRFYTGYAAYYKDDYLKPLATEFTAVDSKLGHTCRYDMVAKVGKNAPEGIPQGVAIVEHKTSSVFTQDTLEGWNMDGEILGEIALWDRSDAKKEFGPLNSVIINVIGKQKNQQFHRTIVKPDPGWSKMHIMNLSYLEDLAKRLKKNKVYPRYNASCISRYGRCDYYQHCLNSPEQYEVSHGS